MALADGGVGGLRSLGYFSRIGVFIKGYTTILHAASASTLGLRDQTGLK